MSTKNNLTVVGADFDQIKISLKNFLKTNSGLTDVDFEGSVASTLIDVLAYNTFYNNVYLNAATNETFLDTAVQRSNVVAHANMLGYTPKSFTSARVTGTIRVTPNDTPTQGTITVPALTPFVTKIENKNYKFQSINNVLLELKDGVYQGVATLYEGSRYVYRYTVNLQNKDQRFSIPSPDIDLELLKVGVLRDNKYSEYVRSETITNVGPTSKVYWVREGDTGVYEVVFGDGVFGEGVSQNDIVVLEYFISNGEIPNGANTFESQVSVGGYSNVTFIPDAPAYGGAVGEDIESVRNNAVRFFETQNRALTWSDYETILMKQFPFLESVSVWGGEENEPPFYGRVFIAAKPTNGEILTTVESQALESYLKTKNVASVIPMFVQPDYVYLGIDTRVKFSYERSPFGIEEVPMRVKNRILEFGDNSLEKFGVEFKYSNLVREIDSSMVGISSNETYVSLVKRFSPEIGVRKQVVINFGAPLRKESIKSTGFVSDIFQNTIYLTSSDEVDTTGEYPITFYYIQNNAKFDVNTKVGSVDYDRGIVRLDFLRIYSVDTSDATVAITATPTSLDFTPVRNQIVAIRDSDVRVNVIPEVTR